MDLSSLPELATTGGMAALMIVYLINTDRDNRKRLADMHEFYNKKLEEQRDGYKRECDERITKLESVFARSRES